MRKRKEGWSAEKGTGGASLETENTKSEMIFNKR